MHAAHLARPVVVVAPFLFACRAPTPTRGEVQREWNSTLRELGINPVYPPREDLQVGDIYVRRGYVDDEKLVPEQGFAPIDLWLAHVNANASLSSFYGARASLPRTPGPDGGTVPAGAQPDGSIFEVGDNSRMRVVAFPDFASMNIRASDLRAFIPVEALGLGLGGSWSGEHQVNVKIPTAESYGLPLNAVLPLVADTSGPVWVLKADIAAPALLVKLHEDVQAWARAISTLPPEQRAAIEDDPLLHLDLITEVFYARAIHVAVSARTTGGARASARPLVQAGGVGTSAEPGGGGTSAVSGAPVSAGDDALARANQLNEELVQLDALDVPGGSLQFLSASDQALAMRRRFDRPIAIGYRAVQLSVDPANGSIVGIGAAANRAGVVTAGDEAGIAQALCDEIARQLEAAGLGTFAVQASTGEELVFRCRAIGTTGATSEDLDRRAKELAAQIAGAVREATGALDDAQEALLARFEDKDFAVHLEAEE